MSKHWSKFFTCVGLLVLAIQPIYGMEPSMSHFKPSGDWVTGDGTWVVVREKDSTNNVLISASLNDVDPKHAWVNKDFGPNYTVKCDVRMDSWAANEDYPRAGVAVRVQPDGSGGGSATNDRSINLLFHWNGTKTGVQFLNDMEAWGTINDVTYAWVTGTWYTFEMTVEGTNVSGSITETAKPANKYTFPSPWDFSVGGTKNKRPTGFPGLTGSSKPGLMVSFDNFQVIVGGNVVFSDDFQKPGAAISQKSGVGAGWEVGEAGMYVVDNGILFGIPTNDIDPKHMWFNKEIKGGGSIKADCKMLSWVVDDWSRSGICLHLQPYGSGGGRAAGATTPGEDRALNLLFHEDQTTIEYLDDMQAWANTDDKTFPWKLDTWYTFVFTSTPDGKIVNGTVTNKSKATETITLKPWTFGSKNRVDGFAGLTASTNKGLICAWDNIEIKDDSGSVIFSDDFSGKSATSVWEVYQ